MTRVQGVKFVGGQCESGRLVLTREDGSTAECPVLIVDGATLVDNGDDLSYNIIFDGS